MNRRITIAVSLLLLACSLSGQSGSSSLQIRRSAVERALPLFQKSAGEFVKKQACLSCHHNVLPILTLHMARKRGFAIDIPTLSTVEERTFREFRSPNALDDAIQGTTFNDPTPNDSYLLMAAQSAGMPAILPIEIYARRLLGWQRDGHWVTSDFRPPHSSSVFTATATAVQAIRTWIPAEMKGEGDTEIRNARRWLVATRPLSTEDAAFRLMGLVWSGAMENELAGARRDLLTLQATDGGWPQLRGYESDAYSTGEALYALHESRFAADKDAWNKGIGYLLSSQVSDGTWRVRTRMLSPAEVSPPYFSTGFPYDKDEFISYAGTAWAVMALLTTLPEQVPASSGSPIAIPSTPTSSPWIRTALFGTTADLQSLLDSGLDPNSATANGTTLLMMVAPSVEKVRLLLARGAHANSWAKSGTDALTVAATYRDTHDSMTALFKAGVETAVPEGVHPRFTALEAASRTGDITNVRLLLAHGADAGAAELSEAVTFGYADVVRALIDHGADAGIKESSGINLLHWAVITNRTSVIPILAKAKVPLNDTDSFGFTPLMYAATLDFGETESLKALLRAGARRDIRNKDGRTPEEQAHYLHLSGNVAVLH